MSKFSLPPNREYRIPPAAPPKCPKTGYLTRAEALAAGRTIARGQATGIRAYQCDTCRTQPGQGAVSRPWHWARSLSTWAGLQSLRREAR